MRLIPSDPDIQTLVSRIEGGDIELQPNFQRGEVWPRIKKQKLIDSILRDWHVPPIHVIEHKTSQQQEVLDGQQRLAAIRDFVRDDFPVDGHIEPHDEEILALHGLRFSDLNEAWRRRVNQFAIRVFRLVEYEPGEPWELFFRLNQTTRLTGAEERNAFFGPVRDQIKSAVAGLVKDGIDESVIGFSNSRMAYDDVVSRSALAITRASITEKITASDLTQLYRRLEPLSDDTIGRLRHALSRLSVFRQYQRRIRLNKASVFTWLMFIARADWKGKDGLREEDLSTFIDYFSEVQSRSMSPFSGEDAQPNVSWQILIFEDRCTARVADTSSVILRDAILWSLYRNYAERTHAQYPLSSNKNNILYGLFDRNSFDDDDDLARKLINARWGDLK